MSNISWTGSGATWSVSSPVPRAARMATAAGRPERSTSRRTGPVKPDGDEVEVGVLVQSVAAGAW